MTAPNPTPTPTDIARWWRRARLRATLVALFSIGVTTFAVVTHVAWWIILLDYAALLFVLSNARLAHRQARRWTTAAALDASKHD